MEEDEDPQEVEKGLFISSRVAARNKDVLIKYGITHILSACVEVPPKFPEDFQYLQLMLLDHPTFAIIDLFPGSISFINEALREGGKVLVHCVAGVSRSATIVLSYLMQNYQMTFAEALRKLQKIRSVVNPNQGFRSQLRQFENMKYKLEQKNDQDQKLINNLMRHFMKSTNLDPNFDFPLASYGCAGCKQKLFEGNELIHGLEFGKKKCNHVFLVSLSWIHPEQMSANEGGIHCPNCDHEIGSYSWSGNRCSCGEWIVPSFLVCWADVRTLE